MVQHLVMSHPLLLLEYSFDIVHNDRNEMQSDWVSINLIILNAIMSDAINSLHACDLITN